MFIRSKSSDKYTKYLNQKFNNSDNSNNSNKFELPMSKYLVNLKPNNEYLDEYDEDIDIPNDNQLTYDELKKKSTLSFTLDYQQLEYIKQIINFINTPNKYEFLLTGGPGTGKSTIISQVIAYLQRNGYSYKVCAPTHKARINLDKMVGTDDGITLHQLLKLSPDLDILELDFRKLKLICHLNERKSDIPSLIIIDECSMISSEMYKFLKDELIDTRHVKIIYVGDSKQLSAVNDKTISKVFSIEDKIELTKIYRQKEDAPLLYILKDLREKPLTKRIENFKSPSGNLYNCRDESEFLARAYHKFKEAIKNKDVNEVKIITYTNRQIDRFNAILHHNIFKDSDLEFCEGEFVMGYENYRVNDQLIVTNSCDYIIKSIKLASKQGDLMNYPFTVNGYDMVIDSLPELPEVSIDEGLVTGRYKSLFFISKKFDEENLKIYAEVLENTRRQAVALKDATKPGDIKLRKILWSKYFKLCECFAVPEDLYYNGKLIRPATLKLGYACTIHKIQGSSINNVFFDLNSVFICKDKEEMRQLEYVALSRSKQNVYILN